MKHIGKLVILGTALAVSASSAFATTITLGSFGQAGIAGSPTSPSGLYAGQGATTYVGSQQFTSDTAGCLPAGSFCLPAYTGNTASAGTTAFNLNPQTSWNAALASSVWVGTTANAGPSPASPAPNTTTNPQYGYYEFTSTITGLTGTYNGSITVMADDTTEVLLTTTAGTSTLIPFGALIGDGHCADNVPNCSGPDTVNLSLLAGTDTLTFIVEQAGNGVAGTDPSGVDFDATLSNTPEPSSLVLLGTGLLGAAGMMFRKRVTV
jgi:hypothetical protein